MSFTVYRSSAGSGKTFTLVFEYLKIILKEPGNFRNILAITFTNKAANEMKERVLKTLTAFSLPPHGNSPEHPMLRPLISATGLSEQEISHNASLALRLILHRYGDFAIGTIDSFSHRIIRTFAYDFKIPLDFQVEIETVQLLRHVVDQLIARAGHDDQLTRVLVSFLETKMEDDQGWDIARELLEFAKNLLDESANQHIQTLQSVSLGGFLEVASRLRKVTTQFETTVRQTAAEAASAIKNCGVDVNAFSYGNKGIARYFSDLANGKFDKLHPGTNVLKSYEKDSWFSTKASNSERQIISEIIPLLKDCFTQIQEMIVQEGALYHIRKILSNSIYPLAVLNEMEKILNELKMQNNIVLISEFNARIASVIMNESVPFIYERLGEQYRHILIDEFQDTSVLQWMNFLPLIENSLASGYFNLVVGDGKQAIYRWRNGDVDQFTSLPKIPGSEGNSLLRQREKALSGNFNPKDLRQNFRSGGEIVRFNNEFFRHIASAALAGSEADVYKNLEQTYRQDVPGGFISLEMIGKTGGKNEYEELTFNRILQILKDIHDIQGYAWKEIAILVRGNDRASAIAAFLLGQGIEVVTAESLLLKNSMKVRFLIALLKFFTGTVDHIVNEEIKLFLQLNDLPYNPGTFSTNFRRTALASVYEFCEEAIRNYNLNKEPDPFLLVFLDVILQFGNKFSVNPVEFLRYWEENMDKLSLAVPEELNAVRVMTIHKAKGLQFPVVIFPFAQETRRQTRDWLWIELEPHIAGIETAIVSNDKKLEQTQHNDLYQRELQKSSLDMLNLLYVVMTRPEQQLFILTAHPPLTTNTFDSLPKMFAQYLKFKGLYQASCDVYTFGSLDGLGSKTAKESTHEVKLVAFTSNDWRNRIRIRTRYQAFHSLADDSQKVRGTNMHKLLSWITTREDVPQVIQRARHAGLLHEDDLEHVQITINELLDHPELQNFYKDGIIVKNEPEILDASGSIHRPDRVVCYPDGKAAVIDYKTGYPEQEHEIQVRKYMELLSAMGYNPVKGIIIYLGDMIHVVEL